MDRMRPLWYRRRLRIVAVVLVVLIVLIGGSYVIMQQTDTVSVKLQVWFRVDHQSQYGGVSYWKSTPDRVFANVVHDSATASRVRAIFDTARPIPWGASFSCSLPFKEIDAYDFVFTWQGLTTETVHWSLNGCGFIYITGWGMPLTRGYYGLFPDQYREMVDLTGIPADSNYQ